MTEQTRTLVDEHGSPEAFLDAIQKQLNENMASASTKTIRTFFADLIG